MPIKVWEPLKRVAWQWGAHSDLNPAPSVVDFHLEAQPNGDTVLRMVHHGFSADADWDHMYDGTKHGWNFELHSLKTYLDHHRGQRRHVAHVRAPLNNLSRAEAFRRVLAPGALTEKGSLADLAPGQRFDVTLTGGQRITGTVRTAERDRYLCLNVDNLDHALMRVDIESCNPASGGLIWLWLSTWGDDGGVARALNEQWLGVLRSCVGSALPIGVAASPE